MVEMRSAPGFFLAILVTLSCVPVPFTAALAQDDLLGRGRKELWAGREEAAVPLFQEYLRGDPGNREARLDLAHAYAWSGQYPEAMREYSGLYKTGSQDPKVIGGMADVLSWSGRKAEALKLYRQALLNDPTNGDYQDARARLEWEATPRLHSEGEYFEDSGSPQQIASNSRIWLDGGEARSKAVLASLFYQQMLISPEGETGSMITGGFSVGAAGLLAPGWTGRAEAGMTSTTDLSPRTLIDASLTGRSLRGISVTLGYSFRDRGYDLRSYWARRAGMTGHEGVVSGYWMVGPAGGVYARARLGLLSDDNKYRSGDLSFDYTLLARKTSVVLPEGRLVWGLWGIDYDSYSPRYYAPQKEWSATGGVLLTLLKAGPFKLDSDLKGGRAANDVSQGEAVAADLRARIQLDRALHFEAGFKYDQSIRQHTYISRMYRLGFHSGD
jgi:tetratricopeptide (TPR) repeat protein